MSWEQLIAIREENRDLQEKFASDPPVVCPNDAHRLDVGPDGELFCEWDGWRPVS